MKHWTKLIVLALLASVGMFADTVIGDGSFTALGSTGFSSGQTDPAPFSTGTPFWNNFSYDTGAGGSHDMNAGYVLTNTGGLTGGTPVLGTDGVANAYLGANGSDPSAFGFFQNGRHYDVSILYANSSENREVNGTDLGWYDIVDGSPVLHQIYGDIANTSSPSAENVFAPVLDSGSQYGLYATVCYTVTDDVCSSSETYFSDSALNTGNNSGGAGWNHFALFNLDSFSESYAIGFSGQNGHYAEGLGDFNDVVIELRDPDTPEPATLSLVGLGLLGLGFSKRRFLKK